MTYTYIFVCYELLIIYPSDNSPCGGNYGGCDQLCIPSSSSTYTCQCADGIPRLIDGSCDVSNGIGTTPLAITFSNSFFNLMQNYLDFIIIYLISTNVQ